MPFSLKVEVDGLPELDIAFARAADSIDNVQKYWPRVADVVYDIEKEQFNTEGARSGTEWASLSPAYAEWKERYLARETFDAKNRILELTTALRRSLTSRDERGVYIETPDSLSLGSSLPYALHHQRGTSKMPARQPYDLRPEDARRIRTAFKEQVEKEVKRAGWPINDFMARVGVNETDDLNAFAGLEWVDDL